MVIYILKFREILLRSSWKIIYQNLNLMDEYYEILKRDLPDTIKLLSENIDLKRRFKIIENEYNDLKIKYRKLEDEKKKYKSAYELKVFEIKDLNSKIQNLTESQASLRRSLSCKTVNSNIKNPPKSKVPLKKSKSISQNLDESIDEIIQDLHNANTTVAFTDSPAKKKKDNLDTFDEYFADNFSIQENNNKSSSLTSISNHSAIQKFSTPHFIIENEKEANETNGAIDFENEIKTGSNTEVNKKVKTQKKKKESILPAPQPISDLLREIKSTDFDQIDSLVTRVLAESISSITALKKRYLDIINTIAVSIKTTNNPDEIHQVILFFIKFSMRISPESLDLFKKSVSSNHKLTSTILAIEEMDGIV